RIASLPIGKVSGQTGDGRRGVVVRAIGSGSGGLCYARAIALRSAAADADGGRDGRPRGMPRARIRAHDHSDAARFSRAPHGQQAIRAGGGLRGLRNSQVSSFQKRVVARFRRLGVQPEAAYQQEAEVRTLNVFMKTAAIELNSPNADTVAPITARARVAAYFELTKPRITFLIMLTSAAGFALAS